MKRLLRDERGQDLIEYAMLLGLAVSLVSLLPPLLDALTGYWQETVGQTLSRVSPPCHVPETYWADAAHTQIATLPPAPGTCR